MTITEMLAVEALQMRLEHEVRENIVPHAPHIAHIAFLLGRLIREIALLQMKVEKLEARP